MGKEQIPIIYLKYDELGQVLATAASDPVQKTTWVQPKLCSNYRCYKELSLSLFNHRSFCNSLLKVELNWQANSAFLPCNI